MTNPSEPDHAAILAALTPYAEKAGRTPEEMLALVTQASEQAIKRAGRLAEKERQQRMARRELDAELAALPKLAGLAKIAEWCGVERAAVSNWLARFTSWPLPAYSASKGYLWRDDDATREAWQAWREDMR